jgi:hypothetical protein
MGWTRNPLRILVGKTFFKKAIWENNNRTHLRKEVVNEGYECNWLRIVCSGRHWH